MPYTTFDNISIYYPMGDPVLEIMMRFENHNSFGIKDIKYCPGGILLVNKKLSKGCSPKR
jgi:hypothetical protein